MIGQINTLVDFVLDLAKIISQDIAHFYQEIYFIRSFIPLGFRFTLEIKSRIAH